MTREEIFLELARQEAEEVRRRGTPPPMEYRLEFRMRPPDNYQEAKKEFDEWYKKKQSSN